MPCLTASHRPPPAVSWTLALAQALLLSLLLGAQLCSARPFAAGDFVGPGGGEDLAEPAAGFGAAEGGSDLGRLCAQSRSFEIRVLCRLTQARGAPPDSWPEADGRTKLVNKRSDGSSLSAFQRFVSQLRATAEDKADAMRQLQRLKAMGVIDSNNQVVRLTDETRNLMEELG